MENVGIHFQLKKLVVEATALNIRITDQLKNSVPDCNPIFFMALPWLELIPIDV